MALALADKFCFNVFLSDSNPSLPHQDRIGADFYRNLLPVWSENENEVKKFWEANSWIKKYFDISPASQKNIFERKNILADSARLFLEKNLDIAGLGFVLEKISFKLQNKYLKNRLKKSCAKLPEEYDFFVSPDLIAYHFPISNYYRELKRLDSENLYK